MRQDVKQDEEWDFTIEVGNLESTGVFDRRFLVELGGGQLKTLLG